MPLACASLKSAPGRIASVRSAVAQIGLVEVGAGKIGARELGFAKIAVGEIRVAQDRAAQVCAAEVGARQIGAAQVRACAAVVSAKEFLVRVENVCQSLSVVLDALWFAQAHVASILGFQRLFYWMAGNPESRCRARCGRRWACDTVSRMRRESVWPECDVRRFRGWHWCCFFLLAGSALVGAAVASPQLVLTHVTVIDSTANAARPDQIGGHRQRAYRGDRAVRTDQAAKGRTHRRRARVNF